MIYWKSYLRICNKRDEVNGNKIQIRELDKRKKTERKLG